MSTKSKPFFYGKLSLAKNAIHNDNEVITLVLSLIAVLKSFFLFFFFSSIWSSLGERESRVVKQLARGRGSDRSLKASGLQQDP